MLTSYPRDMRKQAWTKCRESDLTMSHHSEAATQRIHLCSSYSTCTCKTAACVQDAVTFHHTAVTQIKVAESVENEDETKGKAPSEERVAGGRGGKSQV